MSDFRLNIIAETQKAERKLKQVEKAADKATKARKLNIDTTALNKNFSSLSENIGDAANNIKQFYSVSKKLPGVGGAIRGAEERVTYLAKAAGQLAASAPQAAVGLAESAKAGNIISNSFNAAAGATSVLINRLAKIGFALYGLKEAANVLKLAFGSLFNETIGRAARFQQTLLKTQTTLASTSKVFVDDVEITDPLEKINALQKEIEKRVDSIRIRSIDLAGVTSNEVVEVFSIVASQIGQINGDLKDAEELAIQFSAALGTFGLPMQQARQEIGSILRADIGPDSLLAKSLGITAPDIRKAKTEVGGIMKFLEQKLGAAVAGQEIAAKGLSGVLSNIQDIAELISQSLGEPLLAPIIAASTALYDILFESKDLLQELGKSISSVVANAGSRLTAAFKTQDTLNELPILTSIATQSTVVFETLKKDADGLRRTIEKFITRLGSALRELATSLAAMSSYGLAAFRELIDAFIQLKLVSLESLITAVATLSHGLVPVVQVLTELLRGWADILRLPLIQYFTQLATTFVVLKVTGVLAVAAIITQLVLWAAKIKTLKAKITALGIKVAAVIKTITTSLGSLLLLLAQAIGSLKALLVTQGTDPKIIKQFNVLEKEIHKVGRNAKGVAYNFRNLGASLNTLGRSIGSFMLNLIKANAAILIVTLGITLLVDAFGRLKRAQEEDRQKVLDASIIQNYKDNLQGLNGELSLTQRKAKAAALALVDKNYDDATAKIAELELRIKSLNALLATTAGGRSAGGRRRNARRGLLQAEAELAAYREQQAEALAILEQQEAEKRVRTEADQRRSLAKEIKQLERQIQTDLFQQRQTLARKEVEIFRAAGELRIKEIEKGNAKLIEGEEGLSKAILEGVNQYIATRERGELDIEASRRQLTIEITNLDKLASDYRYSIEQKIAELRKKSADYERQTAEEREAAAKGETSSAATAGAPSLPDPEAIAIAYEAAVAKIKSATAQLQKLSADATRAQIQESLEQIAKTMPKVELEQYTDRLSELKLNMDAIASSAGRTLDPQSIAIGSQGIQQGLIVQREISEAAAGFNKFTKLNATEQDQILDYLTQRYNKYLNGLAEEVKYKKEVLAAERALEFITTSATSVEAINNEIEALKLRNSLRAEGVAPALIQAELQKLEIQRQMNRLLEQATPEQQAGIRAAAARQAAAVDARAQALTAPGSDIAAFIGDAQRELEDLEALAIRVSQSIGNAVGNALTDGIAGLVEGTKTAQEVFSDFLKDMGQILLREAAKMIATYVAVGVARLFAGLGSGGGSEATNNFMQGVDSPLNITDPSAFNLGADFFRANGGPVNANQPYIVGERGPEMFVPFQSGQVLSNGETEAMMSPAFSRNGSVNLPFTRNSETLAAARDPGPINVRYESQVINGVEYVTAEQHRKGMAQAAERGRALTLQALQNSPRTRAKVGI